MMIANLAVTSANLLNATIDKLVLKGADGKYYRVFVGSDGAIHTEEVTVTGGEIEAGETGDGRQIVATSANIGDLNATTIKASEAIIGTIVTESLTAGKITANDALIASLTAPVIYTAAIQALGNSLDLSANESIKLTVQDVRDDIDEVSGAAETALGLAESAQDAANGARTEAANAQVSADEANETAAAIQTELELTKSGLSVVQNETIRGLTAGLRRSIRRAYFRRGDRDLHKSVPLSQYDHQLGVDDFGKRECDHRMRRDEADRAARSGDGRVHHWRGRMEIGCERARAAFEIREVRFMATITLTPTACTSAEGWVVLYNYLTTNSSYYPRQFIFTYPGQTPFSAGRA